MSCSEKIRRMKKTFDSEVKSLEPGLSAQAFTHISYANEQGEPASSNERLEFLGDAVISLVVALHLHENHPHSSEGDLTRMRAGLVSGASLASLAKNIDLGRYLLLGRGEELTGGRRRPRILAGAFEAFVGAFFLQHGWLSAFRLVKGFLLDNGELLVVPVDPKTMLQEIVQRKAGSHLEYVVLDVKGPDHMPEYTVACMLNGARMSLGKGTSKREAEEQAARSLLKKKGHL